MTFEFSKASVLIWLTTERSTFSASSQRGMRTASTRRAGFFQRIDFASISKKTTAAEIAGKLPGWAGVQSEQAA